MLVCRSWIIAVGLVSAVTLGFVMGANDIANAFGESIETITWWNHDGLWRRRERVVKGWTEVVVGCESHLHVYGIDVVCRNIGGCGRIDHPASVSCRRHFRCGKCVHVHTRRTHVASLCQRWSCASVRVHTSPTVVYWYCTACVRAVWIDMAHESVAVLCACVRYACGPTHILPSHHACRPDP